MALFRRPQVKEEDIPIGGPSFSEPVQTDNSDPRLALLRSLTTQLSQPIAATPGPERMGIGQRIALVLSANLGDNPEMRQLLQQEIAARSPQATSARAQESQQANVTRQTAVLDMLNKEEQLQIQQAAAHRADEARAETKRKNDVGYDKEMAALAILEQDQESKNNLPIILLNKLDTETRPLMEQLGEIVKNQEDNLQAKASYEITRTAIMAMHRVAIAKLKKRKSGKDITDLDAKQITEASINATEALNNLRTSFEKGQGSDRIDRYTRDKVGKAIQSIGLLRNAQEAFDRAGRPGGIFDLRQFQIGRSKIEQEAAAQFNVAIRGTRRIVSGAAATGIEFSMNIDSLPPTDFSVNPNVVDAAIKANIDAAILDIETTLNLADDAGYDTRAIRKRFELAKSGFRAVPVPNDSDEWAETYEVD